MTTLRIKQVRSGVGHRKCHRATLKTLGLRRIGQVIDRADTASVRGLVRSVQHLVSFEEIHAQDQKPAPKRRKKKTT